MSDLFDFIYEEKNVCNLLCGWHYGNRIMIYHSSRNITKVIYYDDTFMSCVLYRYTNNDSIGVNDDNDYVSINDISGDNISGIYVNSINYNDICYNCKKHDTFGETYLSYNRMCGDKKYSFTVHPIDPLPVLTTGEAWNVFMEYVAGGNKIKIWLNLRDGMSRVNSHKVYI